MVPHIPTQQWALRVCGIYYIITACHIETVSSTQLHQLHPENGPYL